MLSGDQLLAIEEDCEVQRVEVPEKWGGEVFVRMLSGDLRDAFEVGSSKRKGKVVEQNLQNIRARLCAYCLCDKDGKPLFTHPEQAAIALGKKSSAVLDTIFAAAKTLNALNKEDIDELAKNSDGDQPGDSLSA
jgi:hypothetical protein